MSPDQNILFNEVVSNMNTITDLSRHILPSSPKKPVLCPYCKEEAQFDKGLWRCNPCNALGRADKQTGRPLGTMANNALWTARKEIHQSFGAVMQYHISNGISKTQARKKVINDLANELNLNPKQINIDRFDETLCKLSLEAISKMQTACIPVCPYCLNLSVYLPSKRIYRCDPCDAQVGVHKHNNQPLGTLANAELRGARKKAHSYFDPLWRCKMKRDSLTVSQARKTAYHWLALQMGIDFDDCHIGEFDIEKCNEVMRICKPYIGKAMQQLQMMNE